jgi:hypothetical protein
MKNSIEEIKKKLDQAKDSRDKSIGNNPVPPYANIYPGINNQYNSVDTNTLGILLKDAETLSTV